jgi:hypothetical protein
VLTILNTALDRWKRGLLDDSLIASTFLLLKALEKDKSLLARKSAKFSKVHSGELPQILYEAVLENNHDPLVKLLEGQRLKGYSSRVSDCLENWLAKNWDLKLLEGIPYPSQVHSMQCLGVRPVTMITDESLWGKPIRDHKNELDFMVHDLEHAANFHKSPMWKRTQVAFFNHLVKTEQVIKPHLKNQRFRLKYEYLIADMNSHVLHLILFLRASLLEYLDDRQKYEAVLYQLAEAFGYDGEVRESFLWFEKLPRYEASVSLTEFYETYSLYQPVKPLIKVSPF